ncbi:hypothetical protein [Lysinibacillus sp. G4S2]|uniref:hypothetical protein n=1 Tax=Lysinibacillus sp. G4S2 TaxID=3055859 RepID=UPI0025A30B88|nr:hypothetical protein [Lysinibacillus sp. G4S2]MDM5245956.1 hypothetical protein [Lysinibacillus sp. G4S2]
MFIEVWLIYPAVRGGIRRFGGALSVTSRVLSVSIEKRGWDVSIFSKQNKKYHIIKAREINVSKIDFSRFLRF